MADCPDAAPRRIVNKLKKEYGWQPIQGTTVIGIGHKARHGKDTVANIIVDSVYGAKKYSFGDDLKAMCRVLGMTSKNPPVLQAMGTNVMRALDEDIWVRCLYWRLVEERPRVAVIPDCRFMNEVSLIKALNGKLIKVSRFNVDGTIFQTSDRDPLHPSETALDAYNCWDFDIKVKSGEIDKLEEEADQIIKKLKLF